MKGTGVATNWREIDRWEGGVGWIAYPDEAMQRASHALVDGGDVWVVDPVDYEGLDEFLTAEGDVAGVVILLDRHKRDCAAVARRHDVPVYVPDWMDDVARELDASVERFRGRLGDSEYRLHKLLDNPFWKEGALYGPESGTLVVPEAVGTSGYFRTSDERLGIHPALRMTPPRKLRRFSPDRILVGHGEGVLDDAAGALADALSGARRRAPRLYAKTLREFLL
jgi:hypothetical protein